MSAWRNFIVGKEHYVPSQPSYRYALLRGQIALLGFCIGLFYIFVDSIYQVFVFLHMYVILMIGCGVSFYLNRIERYRESSVVLLLAGNAIVFILTSSEGTAASVHIFFVVLGVAALTLFSYRDLRYSIGFVTLSCLLFVVAMFWRFEFITIPDTTEQYQFMNTIVNLLASMVACVMGIYFLIEISKRSEDALKENQARLLRVSDELKLSQDRLETAIKGSKAGVYEWDIKTGNVLLSPDLKKLFEFTKDELSSVTIDQFTQMIHAQDLKDGMQSIIDTATSMHPYHRELRIRTKSGDYKWFSDSGLCKPDKYDNPWLVVGSMVDISERKKAEEQLLEQNLLLAKANEELDRFVYSTSHDLRAPLSSLLGLISIAEKAEGWNEIREYLTMMRDRVKTMDGFIREITDYSRNSRLEVSMESVPIASLVKGVVENLKYMDDTERVRIVIDIPPEKLIMTDMARIRVVISNLVSNAIKYHDLQKSDPFVRIAYAMDGASHILIINENGQGIRKEHQNKIFNMFYRASENSDGSGLGLYIVKETIEKLNGDIQVESVYGEGSTFTIKLPVG